MSENKKITFDQLVPPLTFRDYIRTNIGLDSEEQRRIATDYAKLYIFTEGLIADNSALGAENSYLRTSIASLEQDYSELVEEHTQVLKEIENKG